MHVFKKLVCGILTFSIAAGIAGCTSTQNPSSGGPTASPTAAMGRYIEQDMNLPDGTTAPKFLIRNEDGSLDYFGSYSPDNLTAKSRHYNSPDGTNWNEEDLSWMDAVPNGDLRAICSDGKDGFYAIVSEQGEKPHLLHTADRKTAKEIPVPSWNEPVPQDGGGSFSMSGGSVTVGEQDGADVETGSGEADAPKDSPTMGQSLSARSMTLLDNGDLLLSTMNFGVLRYTPDGTLVKEFKGNCMDSATNGKDLFVVDYNKTIFQYDLETGSQTTTIPMPADASSGNLTADKDGSLYLAGSSGIQKLAPGGSVWETVMDGSLSTLGTPSVMVRGLALDGDNGFYVLLYSLSDSAKILHCTYSDTTPTVPDTELKVYSLKDSDTVRQAIGAFQQNHPNVFVNYTVGIPDGEESVTVSDVVRSLNTEILAGKGPDVLILDGLPYESYMEKGVLEDISSLLDGSSLLDNITGTFRQDGKTYAVPTRFSVPVMVGDKSVLNQLNSMADFTKQQGDKKLILFETPESTLQFFANVSFSAWKKDSSTLDDQALKQFLSEAKSIYDIYHYEDNGDASMGYISMSMNGGNYVSVDFTGMQYMQRNTQMYMTDATSLYAMQYSLSNQENADNVTAKPIPGQIENAFLPRISAGVNAAGTQKDLAKEFVKTMLSRDVQDYTFADGICVNTASFDKAIADLQNAEMETHSNTDYKALVSSLSTPVLLDTVLLDAVITEGAACLNGKQTPEEAVQKINEQTRIYLSE